MHYGISITATLSGILSHVPAGRNRGIMNSEKYGDTIILRNIELADNVNDFSQYCMAKEKEAIAEALSTHYETIRQIAKPMGILKWAAVEQVQKDSVTISGETFQSRLLADKLKNCKQILLFSVTIGRETEEHEYIQKKLLKSVITTGILYNALARVKEYAEKQMGCKDPAILNPGYFSDWPIKHNITLFSMLGKEADALDITLDEKGFMYPFNTSSGILFSNGNGYTNCLICKIADCPGRTDSFDEKEYLRIFG